MTAQAKKKLRLAAVHPGEVLRETIEERGITQTELSDGTGISRSHISNVVNCKVSGGIGIASALALEEFLGVKAEVWLNLQTTYDLWLAREG